MSDRTWVVAAIGVALLMSGTLFFSEAIGQQLFRNVTSELGIGVESSSAQGPGCAFTDCDGDGDLDIMVVDGMGDPNAFFRQDGPRDFVEVASPLGVDDTGWGKAVVFADMDNDGDQDLLLTRMGDSNILYRNDDGAFVDISSSSGFDFMGQNSGAAWADYDRDGLLDVYITNYISLPNTLMRNIGNGVFENVTSAAGVENSTGYGFQPVWLDYDNDGDADLYVANDIFGTGNAFFRNDGDGTFTDVSAESGTDIHMSAMGLAVGDYDNDGYLDIYITNLPGMGLGNILLHNNGDGTFTDVAEEAGVAAFVTCWGANFLDQDHDGRLDLYVAVYLMDFLEGAGDGDALSVMVPDPRFERLVHAKEQSREIFPNLLYRNLGDGTFSDVSAGSGADHAGRSYSSSLGDYDQDGDCDILLTNFYMMPGDSSSALLENLHVPRGSQSDDWLRVHLTGTASNRDGIGARVWIRTDQGWQHRERRSGGSYLGCDEPYLHFGIPDAGMIHDLYVRWPAGLVEHYTNVLPGQVLFLVEGEGTPSSVESTEENSGRWSLAGVYPNPVRTGAEIRLRLGGSRGRLGLHDAGGRLLRTFRTQGPPGGEIVLRWDGRDERGRELGAGTYFLTLTDGRKGLSSRRIVILR